MKLIYSLIAGICIFGLSGCTPPNDPAVVRHNREVLSGQPTEVGVLPDGRVLSFYEIDRGDQHNHFVYVVGGVTTINRTVPQGKHSYNETVVVIDGVKYAPVVE